VPAPGSRLPAWCALSCALALGGRALAQEPEQLRFEVASVKPHPDTGDMRAGIEENEALVRIDNLPLRAIIAIAYEVMPAAVNGPAWLERRTFDIAARPPQGYTRAQMPTLLRNLLVERFLLVARRETREAAGYALRVAPALNESLSPLACSKIFPANSSST
jgi:uncharacterized protein (TIGR03435 family)